MSQFGLLSQNREYHGQRACDGLNLPNPSNERISKWLQDLPVPSTRGKIPWDKCPLNMGCSAFDNQREQTPFPEASSESTQRPPSSIASDSERIRISNKKGFNAGAKVGTIIHFVGVKMPGSLRTHALQITHRERTEPKEHIHRVCGLMCRMCQAVKGDIPSIRDAFLDPRFLDLGSGSNYSELIATSCNAPFDRRGLPGWCFPEIATPEPDYCIGYSWKAFTGVERKIMQLYRLEAQVMPTQIMFWPFLVIQFPSMLEDDQCISRNQNVGTGIYAANSMATILHRTRELPFDLTTDSACFSCVVAEDHARLSVHWAEGFARELSFCSAVIHVYNFRKEKTFHKFRAAVHNIIDYGVGVRLRLIKKALAELRPDIRCWDDEQED